MEMEQVDIAYVELLTDQLLRSPQTGEQLVHRAVEQLGQTLQYLCAISDTVAVIDLVGKLQVTMEGQKERLIQIHEALQTSLEVRRDLNSLEIVKA